MRAEFQNDSQLTAIGAQECALRLPVNDVQSHNIAIIFDLPVDVGSRECGVADPLRFDHDELGLLNCFVQLCSE